MADQSIGMMEGAFFVSKGEILNWLNTLLKTNLTKIEQLGTGAAYCQVLDSMYPGKIKISRVNWKARNEWEFIVNLKILQQTFQKCNIKKHIEIEKLAKAKYQDNLEFAQWMKRFFDLNGGVKDPDYDPIKRRSGGGENDIDMDFSFVELRDNGKRRDRTNEGSQDRYGKKLISRSKSPIFKGLEKNPPLLYSKSKEIRNSKNFIEGTDNLVQKVKQIESVTNDDNLSEAQKLLQIKQILEQANKLPIMQQQQKIINSNPKRFSQNQISDKNNNSNNNNNDSNNVIVEEIESPRGGQKNSSSVYQNDSSLIQQSSDNNNSKPITRKRQSQNLTQITKKSQKDMSSLNTSTDLKGNNSAVLSKPSRISNFQKDTASSRQNLHAKKK